MAKSSKNIKDAMKDIKEDIDNDIDDYGVDDDTVDYDDSYDDESKDVSEKKSVDKSVNRTDTISADNSVDKSSKNSATSEKKSSEKKSSEKTVSEESKKAEVSSSEKPKFKPDIKNLIILLLDFFFVILAYIIALMSLTEVDFKYVSFSYLANLLIITPYFSIGLMVVFFIFRLYINDKSPLNIRMLERLFIANVIGVVAFYVVMKFFGDSYPRIYYLVGGMLQFMFTGCIRFVYRLFTDMVKSS